jgi:hypothetical protein
VANLLISVLAAVLGGYGAAFMAGRSPLLHAGILTAILFALSLVSVIQGPQPGQPAWYPSALMVIMPIGVMLGGYLRSL